MTVEFIRDVMRSEFIGLSLRENDYVEVSEGTEGVLTEDTFMGGIIPIISIDDDPGFVYPRDSYQIKVSE